MNLDKVDAQAQATRAGLVLRYADPRHDGQVPKDAVLAQDPASASRILKGGTITLTLSLGPERLAVPDVVGKEFDLATTDLTDGGLKVVEGASRYHDSLPEGMVVATDPEAGTEVEPGHTVTVTLSKGRAPISVPNLVGKSLNEARSTLNQLGLVLVEPPTVKESDRPRNEVLGQSPADGAGVEKGAKVSLVVSQGPPQVVVPRVIGMPCQQARQMLEEQSFPVAVRFNRNGTVRFQSPGENSQVPPGTQITLGCL